METKSDQALKIFFIRTFIINLVTELRNPESNVCVFEKNQMFNLNL
jgi:hypothetical protein